jgi:hypothetical protein
MNLLTLLGNAIVDDQEFVEKFFTDPVGTARLYGLPLSGQEEQFAISITQDPQAANTKDSLLKVRTCPVRPCAVALPKPHHGDPGCGEKGEAA